MTKWWWCEVWTVWMREWLRGWAVAPVKKVRLTFVESVDNITTIPTTTGVHSLTHSLGLTYTSRPYQSNKAYKYFNSLHSITHLLIHLLLLWSLVTTHHFLILTALDIHSIGVSEQLIQVRHHTDTLTHSLTHTLLHSTCYCCSLEWCDVSVVVDLVWSWKITIKIFQFDIVGSIEILLSFVEFFWVFFKVYFELNWVLY